MAAALRKCMAMGDAEVIECVANLATVRHEDLNRLLSALFRNVMQHLVVATGAARDRVTERLTAGRVRQLWQHPACPQASAISEGSAAHQEDLQQYLQAQMCCVLMVAASVCFVSRLFVPCNCTVVYVGIVCLGLCVSLMSSHAYICAAAMCHKYPEPLSCLTVRCCHVCRARRSPTYCRSRTARRTAVARATRRASRGPASRRRS